MTDAIQGPEPVPERTTPQGTQEAGVERGHEHRDVNFRAVLAWIAGLAVAGLIISALMWVSVARWSVGAERRERLPSPLFTQREAAPPPRLLPNPVDAPAPRRPPLRLPEPLQGPAEFEARMQRREAEQLARYGLLDPATRQPRIPPRVVREVVTRAAARRAVLGAPPLPDALRRPMPSDSSGGTAVEDRSR